LIWRFLAKRNSQARHRKHNSSHEFQRFERFCLGRLSIGVIRRALASYRFRIGDERSGQLDAVTVGKRRDALGASTENRELELRRVECEARHDARLRHRIINGGAGRQSQRHEHLDPRRSIGD